MGQYEQQEQVTQPTGEKYLKGGQPDICEIIEAGISASPETSDPLRKALQAERLGEMNPELETIIDVVVGIKLLQIQGDEELRGENAEDLVVRALSGEPEAKSTAERALEFVLTHDERSKIDRAEDVYDYLKGEGYEEAQIQEVRESRQATPEQIGYQHLSLVHATDHEPRIHRTDGMLHIDDRFSGSGLPRSTIHVALNHMVEAAPTSSNWSGRRVIVVAPMKETVDVNGDPSSLVGHDTWWETVPGKGLVLPKETIIIKPGASRAVQDLDSNNEIRYKNVGITPEDVDQLVAMSGDYELAISADELGLSVERIVKGGELEGTSLDQYETGLWETDRQKVEDALKKALEIDEKLGTNLFTSLAKRVAVRLALEKQGHEVIEPKTIMEASFMSQDIEEDFSKLQNQKKTWGNHFDTPLYGLEKSTLGAMDKHGKIDQDDRARLRKEVQENVRDLSRATLHMYYRLGLL